VIVACPPSLGVARRYSGPRLANKSKRKCCALIADLSEAQSFPNTFRATVAQRLRARKK
jgi:hypothetical protein